MLVNKGADVAARDSQKQTALHVAALYGQAAMVRALMDAGTAVDVAEREAMTPLHFACLSG